MFASKFHHLNILFYCDNHIAISDFSKENSTHLYFTLDSMLKPTEQYLPH